MNIPVTPDSFGVIHSDLKTQNYMLGQVADNSWEMTIIDFDNSQRSWYIIDLSTIVFRANRQLTSDLLPKYGQAAYEAYLE
jgi:Ser/Thr protein kinase RdoA (MazF antagonist)